MYSRQDLVGFLRENVVLLLLVSVVLGGLALCGLWVLLRKRRESTFVLWYLVVPFACAALASFKIPLLEERYFIIVTPAFYMLLSIGAVMLGRRLGTAAFVGLLLLMVFSLHNYYFDSRFGKAQWREVAAYVESSYGEEDALVFYPVYVKPPFQYYSRKEIEVLGVDKGDFEGLRGLIDEIEGESKRTWLVLAHCPYTKALVVRIFEDRFQVVEHKEFPVSSGIEVYLFETSDTGIQGGAER
jgi:hypothetical protein